MLSVLTRLNRIVVSTTIPWSAKMVYRYLFPRLVEGSESVYFVSTGGQELDEIADTYNLIATRIDMARSVSLKTDCAALAQWVRFLLKARPRTVFGGTPKAGLLSMLASALCRVPRRIYILHGLRLEGKAGASFVGLWICEWITIHCATNVLVVSRSLAHRARDLHLAPARRFEILGKGTTHGIDLVRFKPIERRLVACGHGANDTETVIGFVGRLTADKGIAAFSEAVRILTSRGRIVHVLLVGPQDEPDFEECVTLMKDASPLLTLVPGVEDPRTYYAMMDIFCLPTRREGFPNVVLEASAMEIPIVTTRATGAIDSIVPGTTGLLVDVDRPDQLADALDTLVQNPDLRREMGRQGRIWVSEQFETSRVTDLYAAYLLN